MRYDLTDAPTPSDLDALSRSLAGFNAVDVGPSERRPLAIFVRGTTGELDAGLSGYTAWGWLFTQWLWVAEHLRGQGVARRLLAIAETEAVARGCHAAWIDTFNPVALQVYRRVGYEIFGELPEFPRGRTRTFLRRRLVHP